MTGIEPYPVDDQLYSDLTRAVSDVELTISVKRGPAGHPQPQVLVECRRGCPEPRARAAVFAVAAMASLATPLGESWVVRSDPGARRVYLDLAPGAHGRDIERAMRLLRIVIGRAGRCPRN